MLSDALLKVADASGSQPFKEAVRELVARMSTGWDIGGRLGQFAYRNQLYIRRANDAFSRKFREVYLPSYLLLAMLIPFLGGTVEGFISRLGLSFPIPPGFMWVFVFAGLGLALYLVHMSPPLDRTGFGELYLFMVRNPQTRWMVAAVLILIGPMTLGIHSVTKGAYGWMISVLGSPVVLFFAWVMVDHLGNHAAEELETRFRQGLEDTASYISGHQSLEWSLNEAFGNEFLLDLGIVRDRHELMEGFQDLARRFPLRTFKRTATILKATIERGIEVGDALRLLAQGLWEHHLIRFRRREQNQRDLLIAFVVMLAILGLLPLAALGFDILMPPILKIASLSGFLLVYLVGIGRL